MNHYQSVFANSCVKTPIDPVTKMPKTAYERKQKQTQQCFIDSSASSSIVEPDTESEKVKEFYKSIPDYTEINHLDEYEFNSTLKTLRDKKKTIFGLTIEHVDYVIGNNLSPIKYTDPEDVLDVCKNVKSNCGVRRQISKENKVKTETNNSSVNDLLNLDFKISSLKPSRKSSVTDVKESIADLKKPNCLTKSSSMLKSDRPKRNHSACSISWNDAHLQDKNEVDVKFNKFFGNENFARPLSKRSVNDDFKTQSMPSSPLRMKRGNSPVRKKHMTIPKPFKMTERDEDNRVVHELRRLQKSFSDDMLHRKCEGKQFRARPVPIESRIPLYDKILEDQAMRRAITKINSEAELRAQIKPFSFTKREEKGTSGVCDKVLHSLPKSKKKKRFRARPVPKNLFSNYFYDKVKEDQFFRSLNKRIRAEEMLRSAKSPGNLTRDRSRLSTPAAHSDLPTDPSPAAPSVSSSDVRPGSPVKGRRKKEKFSKDFITTTPQPFRFKSADRAAKKTEDALRKIYQESKSTDSLRGSPSIGLTHNDSRALSALELRAYASGRSNLAALLRAEAVRHRFEEEAARRLIEQRRRLEMKQRDRVLRTNPAWHLVKNNHEQDIAMRLQTRRDEERLRREEFLHEMELMYGRVQQQPMLFERYYAPRPYAEPVDSIQLSPRNSKKNRKKAYMNSDSRTSPNRSRKVSINDAAEEFQMGDYLKKLDDKYSDSDVGLDSLDRCNSKT